MSATFVHGSMKRLVACLPHMLHWTRIDTFGHTVKVDEKAEEDLICGRAILMNSAQIAQNRNAGNVLAVEG